MPRTLAIGDIHGCFTALTTLERFVGFRDDDVLVTLGDYVNRGPQTRQVIEWLLEMEKTGRLRPLRGNHEIMMLEGREDAGDFGIWMRVGGDATLRSYAKRPWSSGKIEDVLSQHWQFLEERLLAYYEMETHFFVHASAVADLPLAEQPDFTLYWERFDDPPRHISGKQMVCGHSSQRSGLPARNEHAICIDTRAYGGGWLSCLDVATGQLWQADEEGRTRKLQVD